MQFFDDSGEPLMLVTGLEDYPWYVAPVYADWLIPLHNSLMEDFDFDDSNYVPYAGYITYEDNYRYPEVLIG